MINIFKTIHNKSKSYDQQIIVLRSQAISLKRLNGSGGGGGGIVRHDLKQSGALCDALKHCGK